MVDDMQAIDAGDLELERRFESYARARLSPDPGATARIRARVMREARLQHEAARIVAHMAPVTMLTRRSVVRRVAMPLLAAVVWLGIAVGTIAAAHAGCFSMALSAELGKASITPESIETKCTVTFEKTDSGFTITESHLDVKARIPGGNKAAFDKATTDAKAGCLYPNNGRALTEARARGFDNCLMCDMLGNVAELGSANVFFAKDGVVYTPATNGTFLAGITRYRVITLLRDAGVTVIETSLRYPDFENADEIFSSGNYSKVVPVVRIGDRSLQPGPFYRKARELYWDFAHS